MSNTLTLIAHPESMSGPRHGGAYVQRHHTIVVNGQIAEQFTEGETICDWSTGGYYDRFIADRIAWWERLLMTKVVKGRTEQTRYAYKELA